jgi:hypothetical protein
MIAIRLKRAGADSCGDFSHDWVGFAKMFAGGGPLVGFFCHLKFKMAK